MGSFAWGLAPSSARVPLAKLGGCTVTDLLWQNNVSLMAHQDATLRAAPSNYYTGCDVSLVPRLLLRELVISVAKRLLPNNETILTVPRFTVNSANRSDESPPQLWLVSLTVCFPCEGTPVTRCVRLTALLDAEHIERIQVLAASDAGVVPAEEAVSGGTLPFNARTIELSA